MTAMRLKRYPSPSGGFALGKMSVGATMLKQGKTARDYVQDGLIAMWDGTENAGWGQHSNAAPVDLINGVQLTAFGSPVITDTTFDTPPGANYYADISAFKDAVNNINFTFETVLSGARAGNNGVFSMGSTGSRALWIYGNGAYNISTVNIMATSYLQAISPKYQNDETFRLSVVGGATPLVLIGTTEYHGTYGTLTSNARDRVYIGALEANGAYSSAFKSFRNIRLYSRALTADEIAHNYAIDKERFNLP